jgi:hypothetical protein
MWAFSDESERSGVMLFAVAVIDPGDVDSARRKLRALLLAGQRQVHTAKEAPRRRRVLLVTVGAIDGLSTASTAPQSADTGPAPTCPRSTSSERTGHPSPAL